MTFSLNSKIIEPDNNSKMKNAIVLLHGYGGDGKDISTLSINWKRFLQNTLFICPDGHEKCSVNPAGFQWFDLTRNDPKYILEESLKAEKKLFKFIEEVKIKYKLDNSQICILGFSQGCMMSINLGLTSREPFNCIVGFSGKIIDKNDLAKRKNTNTNFFLVHGENDDVVAPTNLLDAKDFFIRNNVNAEIKMIQNCGHHIPIAASSLALNFIRKNLLI